MSPFSPLDPPNSPLESAVSPESLPPSKPSEPPSPFDPSGARESSNGASSPPLIPESRELPPASLAPAADSNEQSAKII